MPTCAVVICSNGSGRNEKTHEDGTKATLLTIPRTEGLQKQWAEQINRKDFKVNERTRVCSLHFEADAFVDEALNHDNRKRKRKRKKLKPKAIPTLNLRPPKPPEIETERDKRGRGRKTKFYNDEEKLRNAKLAVKEKPFKCSKCLSDFMKKARLESHLCFKCDLCNKNFKSRRSFNRHDRVEHEFDPKLSLIPKVTKTYERKTPKKAPPI